MSALAKAALDYAQHGLSVFPCHSTDAAGRCTCGKASCDSPGKHPRITDNLRKASADAAQIEEWWARWPDANIGVSCGGSGLAVPDIDEKDGRAGRTTWRGLRQEMGASIEDTAIVETPSDGGFHVWYRANGYRVGSKNDLLGSGVDVKAEGGYVLAPPSSVAGVEYAWAEGHELDRLAAIPPALGERLSYTAKTPPKPGAERIPKGSRHDALASLAGTMTNRGCSEKEIAAALHAAAAERCDPPYTDSAAIDAIAHDAATKWTRNGAGAEPTVAGPFHLTELGNAERLAARHKGSVFAVRKADELRGYDPSRGIYTAEHSLLVRYAADVVRSMYTEAADGLTDSAKALRKHAARSEAKRALDAMLDLSKSLKALEAEVEDFDRDPELLNTHSGVVNLRTGELREHAPDYKMTRTAGCEYAPGAATPMWDAFLDRIFEGDAELIAFMQRLFGYALTGYIGEQIFAIFHGDGANGKSVLVDSWHAAMGDYAASAAMKTFLAHRAEAVRTDLASFCGRRLVSTSESKPGQVIDAATIKVMTSKYVTARFLYQRAEFTYTPQYLVILDTNFKPLVQCDDYAIKRRVLLVPFGVLIPDAEQDKELTDKLIAAELPGILAWGVAGAADYLARGLRIPDNVRAATGEYREEMDALHDFWKGQLVFGEAGSCTAARALRLSLEEWAGENGVDTKDLPKGAEWGRLLRERGARSDKAKIDGKTVSVWRGVRIGGEDVQEVLT